MLLKVDKRLEVVGGLEEGPALGLFRPNLLKPESDPGVAEALPEESVFIQTCKKVSHSLKLHILSKVPTTIKTISLFIKGDFINT